MAASLGNAFAVRVLSEETVKLALAISRTASLSVDFTFPRFILTFVMSSSDLVMFCYHRIKGCREGEGIRVIHVPLNTIPLANASLP